MNKLFIIEGIPGSGKTTIAKKISEYLSNSIKTNLYCEGDLHPADLAWCACIPIDSFDEIIGRFQNYKNEINNNMYIENGYAIVAYTQFPIEDKELYKLFESYEVYDNRVSFDLYTRLHLERWQRFSKRAQELQETNVFECSYLQNHVNELMFFHNLSENEINQYLLQLIEPTKNLNPVLFYLDQPDVYGTISRVSNIRTNRDGEKEWMNRVIEFIENCPYGICHNLKGFDGMVKAFEARKQIELSVVNKLPITTYIIRNENYNWDGVWNNIRHKISVQI